MANKLKRCKQCREYHPAEEGAKHPAGWFHSHDCAIKYAQAAQKRARAKQQAKAKREQGEKEKAARAKHRADKERVKPTSEWLDKLQRLVNQYVVQVRDKGKPCCTCGKTDPSVKYDAGHYRSRGAYAPLRFELTNLHRQCSVNCNQHGSGMRAEYRDFITDKYGKAHLEWLDRSDHPLLKDQFPHYEDIKVEIDRYRELLRDNGIKPNV